MQEEDSTIIIMLKNETFLWSDNVFENTVLHSFGKVTSNITLIFSYIIGFISLFVWIYVRMEFTSRTSKFLNIMLIKKCVTSP